MLSGHHESSSDCHERLGTGVLGANVSAVQCLRSKKKSGQDEHRALVAHRGAGGQEMYGLPAAKLEEQILMRSAEKA